jgi:hypothetical protein
MRNRAGRTKIQRLSFLTPINFTEKSLSLTRKTFVYSRNTRFAEKYVIKGRIGFKGLSECYRLSQPLQSYDKITFKNLTDQCRIRIYNITR